MAWRLDRNTTTRILRFSANIEQLALVLCSPGPARTCKWTRHGRPLQHPHGMASRGTCTRISLQLVPIENGISFAVFPLIFLLEAACYRPANLNMDPPTWRTPRHCTLQSSTHIWCLCHYHNCQGAFSHPGGLKTFTGPSIVTCTLVGLRLFLQYTVFGNCTPFPIPTPGRGWWFKDPNPRSPDREVGRKVFRRFIPYLGFFLLLPTQGWRH